LTRFYKINLLPKSRKDRPARRICLRCRKEFNSWGWYNRLCNDCRHANEQTSDVYAINYQQKARRCELRVLNETNEGGNENDYQRTDK
jgi:hypothetical protein